MDKAKKKLIRMKISHLLNNKNPNYAEIQRLINILENKKSSFATRKRLKKRVVIPYEQYAKCFDEGMSAKEIMAKLNCGENTLYTHKRTWRKEKESGQKTS